MENERYDKKSLRLFTKQNSDWKSLVKDCVCFANAKGGIIDIGIEDNDNLPPIDQKIENGFLDILRKRISELTVNVGVKVSKQIAVNGGEFIRIEILPSQTTIASTTDGQYYIRI